MQDKFSVVVQFGKDLVTEFILIRNEGFEDDKCLFSFHSERQHCVKTLREPSTVLRANG